MLRQKTKRERTIAKITRWGTLILGIALYYIWGLGWKTAVIILLFILNRNINKIYSKIKQWRAKKEIEGN